MAGYIVLGIGFGISLNSAGYPWYWATISALIIYAGSMQYVTLDLLASGANIITCAVMTLFVNLRHLFYGIAFIDRYKDAKKYKPYLIFSLTDEVFSLIVADKHTEEEYYFYVSLLSQSYWVLGCTLGGILGTLISFDTSGIEFSMTTIFVISFINQWQETENHLPALTGLVISVVCLVVFGSDNFLIPTMALLTFALFVEKKCLEVSEYELFNINGYFDVCRCDNYHSFHAFCPV